MVGIIAFAGNLNDNYLESDFGARQTMNATQDRPLLSWAGGKTHLVNRLQPFVIKDFAKRRYWEPFLGGGSMFFALRPSSSVLSDLNEHLMHCYEMVSNDPDLVFRYIRTHACNSNENYYYHVRNQYNKSNLSAAQAARFIYLNKASYNGVFRVNLDGDFNVPYGHRTKLALPTIENLRRISESLRSASLQFGSYEVVLENVERGDFVYLDPPYPPLNGTAYFTHYTKERFAVLDQLRLATIARDIGRKGCLVMISNADTPEIRHLYRGWNIVTLSVRRWISCKAQKHKVNEVVIRNYR